MNNTYILDIETTGLDRYKDNLNVTGIYCLETGDIYQPLSIEDFYELYLKLNLKDNLVIAHNATFDIKFLQAKCKHFLPFNNLLDTVILYYLFDPYLQKYKLKELVKMLFGVEYDVGLDIKTGVSEKMLEYNILDLQYTGVIYNILLSKLSNKEVRLAKYLTRISFIYSEATEIGMQIDTEMCRNALKIYQQKYEELGNSIEVKEEYLVDLNSTFIGYYPMKVFFFYETKRIG